MSKQAPAPADAPVYVRPGHRFMWVVNRTPYPCEVEGRCPSCAAIAIVHLPEPLLEDQHDGTTHVCHPNFGGCNQGFEVTSR